MNKEQQIKEMAKIIDDLLTEARRYLGSMNRGKGYWIAQKLVEHYQPKIPEDSVVLSREEHEILVKTAQGKIGNMKATDFLKACISSGVMVEAVSTKEQVKQTVKEFTDELKAKVLDKTYINKDFNINISDIYKMIEETLKEYEK